jgi:ATP-dependent Clp protease ATP-binding subunit ClpC
MQATAGSGTLARVFEHFTENARRVLVLAQEETRNLHDRSIDPGHLLLGMLREGQGIAAKALSDTGVHYERCRELIEREEDQGTRFESGPPPFSTDTMRILEFAAQISWANADGGVGTEHLLVALLERGNEATEAVLAGLDVTPQEIEQRVDALLAERSLQ